MEMGLSPRGLPEGVHTGGPWLSPDGKDVWKPLDAKPYANAECLYPTQEAQCLKEMVGKPGFPENWHVRPANGRFWLVRPKCWLIPQDYGIENMDLDRIMEIEQGSRALNKAGWELNDTIQAAIDPDSNLLILDLSAAHKVKNPSMPGYCDEFDRVVRWYEQLGLNRMAELRRAGRKVYRDTWHKCLFEEEGEFIFTDVYASINRPVSGIWAKISGARYVEGKTLGCGTRVWTWILTTKPEPEKVLSYELTWAYGPTFPRTRREG